MSISLPHPKSARFCPPHPSVTRPIAVWGPPLTLAVLSLLSVLALLLAPPASGPVALVFPPWWSARQVAEGAFRAGRLVRFGGMGFIAVVIRDPQGSHWLDQSGAWLTLNPRVAGLCTPSPAPRESRE